MLSICPHIKVRGGIGQIFTFSYKDTPYCTVLLCSASWGSPWCSLTPFRFGRDQTRQLSLKWLPGERPKTAESCHKRPWLNPSIAAWPHNSKLDEGQQTQSAASTGQPRNGESYSNEIFSSLGVFTCPIANFSRLSFELLTILAFRILACIILACRILACRIITCRILACRIKT